MHPWLAMAGMGEIPMPGGWRLSALWLPMCGQSWLDGVAGFTGHWAAMMVPMMLPAVVAPLWRYGAALHGARRWSAVVLAGVAWALAWVALGVPLYAFGSVLAQALPRAPTLARCVPVLSALAGILAAAWQCASWRHDAARHVAAARAPFTLAAAVRHGAGLGGHCIRQCAGLTAALLCAGITNHVAMGCAGSLVVLRAVRTVAWPPCAAARRSRAGSPRASG